MSVVVQIYRERLPFHPLLGRHILLDSRSVDYAVQPTAASVKAVRHTQHIGILDQGQVGACTGNASTSCAYHEPFFLAGEGPWRYTPDEAGAQSWYHDNTVNDGYPGTWSPNDTGSDGLTSSKMAVKAGVAAGYQAALDLDSSLQALMKVPGITGIPWYNSMFTAPSSGLLTVDMTSGLAGGHELVVDEIVAADGPGNGTGKMLVGGNNSWGESWGAQGRWYMTAADWWALRQQQGDVYFWTPDTAPDPTPAPPPAPNPPGPEATTDENLWRVGKPFTQQRHVVPEYKTLAATLLGWAAGKDFTL